jgi:hypothetical protein
MGDISVIGVPGTPSRMQCRRIWIDAFASRRTGYEVAMDAMDTITMLKQDHRNEQALFTRFERAGDRAYATKRTLVDNMIEELSKHAAIEEQLFYPTTRVPGRIRPTSWV